NMVSSSKAEALDRYRNRAAVYDALGQERKAAEDRQRMDVIQSARTHGELAEKLTVYEESTVTAYAENKAMNALGSVIEALFHLCTDPPGSGAEERSKAKFAAYWVQMKEADPDVSWQKIMDYPAYRDRVIFTESQMAVLEKKFREVHHG
ncbi:MAG: hypothetical protein JXR55_06150, partial [Candidatus Fermentibacteraceae bacterium]|nr:hypothetical protein [Candidatus Fermentibacteraceae bacterium]